jgi:alpha-2-macroglobulin
LLADLTNVAVVDATGSHWEESKPSIKAWIMATDVRTTAAVLDALIRLRPDHPLIQSAVRWLMAARRDEHGYWETTHDTAQSLLTLTDYLTASGELQGNFEWQLGVNGQTRQHGVVSPSTLAGGSTQTVVSVPQLQIGENRVDLIRAVGPGRLYYTVQLRSFGTAQNIPFLSHGFSVGREYLTATGQPLAQAHVGDLVQVRLTLMAPAALQGLVLEDPLPAGFEPVDTQLKTTSQTLADALRAAQPPGWQPWTHVGPRSDRVALFANYVARGAYQYTYLARAALPGEYHVLPVNGREQYFPDVFARGDGQQLTVLP